MRMTRWLRYVLALAVCLLAIVVWAFVTVYFGSPPIVTTLGAIALPIFALTWARKDEEREPKKSTTGRTKTGVTMPDVTNRDYWP